MSNGSQTMHLKVDFGLKIERTEMRMIRWMCGVSMKDRRTSEELRKLVGVQPITTVIRRGKLRLLILFIEIIHIMVYNTLLNIQVL